MNRYSTRVTKLARAYCAAEAAVIASFFSRPRRNKDHLRWLRAQAFKEYSAIKPIFTALAKLYPHIDKGIDRHDFEELTEKLADETKHARLVMDLLEDLGNKKVSCADLLWLPADKRLARIRARYSKSYATLLHGAGAIRAPEIRRTDEALERAAITLTEGGGGALYRVCSRLKKRGAEGKIARVFGEILRDETAHKDSGARSLKSLVGTEAAFLRVAEIVSQISRQRLRMRNEQFGFPLSEAEVRALDRSAWSSTGKPVAPSITPVGRNPEQEPPAKSGARVEGSRRAAP
jgi:rubrerythrin